MPTTPERLARSTGGPAGPAPAGGALRGWGPVVAATLALAVLVHRLADALVLFMRAKLNPDVLEFLHDAAGMSAFYDCPTREPFHVLWLKVGLALSDDAELVARVTTLVQTVLAAGLLFGFGARHVGRATSLVALALFCVNPVVRYYGVSGLRDPLHVAMELLFALLLFAPLGAGGRAATSLLAGLTGGLLVLTRVYAVGFVAGAIALLAVRERAWRRERRRAAAVPLGLALAGAAAIVVPDVVLRPPSPVHDRTAKFFHHLEVHGEPGDWRSDPPISHVQYVFGEHDAAEVAFRIVKGYALYPVRYLPHWLRGYEWLWVLLPVGAVAALARKRGFVVGLLVLSLAHVAFLLELDMFPGVRGIEARYVYPAFPFALLLVVHGGLWIGAVAARAAGRRWPVLGPTAERVATLLLPPPDAATGARPA